MFREQRIDVTITSLEKIVPKIITNPRSYEIMFVPVSIHNLISQTTLFVCDVVNSSLITEEKRREREREIKIRKDVKIFGEIKEQSRVTETERQKTRCHERFSCSSRGTSRAPITGSL